MVSKDLLSQTISDTLAETCTNILGAMPMVSPRDAAAALDTGTEKKIVASIGVVGTIEGSIVLVMSQSNACKAVGKMLAMELTQISQDVLDGVGELTNILAGGVKTRLDAAGISFDISIPTVILGESSTTIARLNAVESFRWDVDCQEFGFEILVSFVSSTKPSGEKRAAGSQASDVARAKLMNIIKGG